MTRVGNTPKYKRVTLGAFNVGFLGGHVTRLKVLPRRDTLLTRVGYMLKSEARIRPVWFGTRIVMVAVWLISLVPDPRHSHTFVGYTDAVRKFPPLPFGPHTRVRDLPKFRLPEDSLVRSGVSA